MVVGPISSGTPASAAALRPGRNSYVVGPRRPTSENSSSGGPPDSQSAVRGTTANRQLQRDVRKLLWTLETKKHADCGFEVVKAEPYGTNELSKVGRSSAKGRRLDKRLRADGLVHVEKWTVKCCGNVNHYEVSLISVFGQDGRRDGTDVAAEKLN